MCATAGGSTAAKPDAQQYRGTMGAASCGPLIEMSTPTIETDDTDEVSNEFWERLEFDLGLCPGTSDWTFACFSIAHRPSSQIILILLDAALRHARSNGEERGLYRYRIAGRRAIFSSRRAFRKRFGFSFRVRSSDFTIPKLNKWFFEDADTEWLRIVNSGAAHG